MVSCAVKIEPGKEKTGRLGRLLACVSVSVAKGEGERLACYLERGNSNVHELHRAKGHILRDCIKRTQGQ